MAKETLKIDIDQGIETITVCNPRFRNAITPRLIEEFIDELQRIDKDPAVKVVVITGEGDAFSSGGYVPDFTKSWEKERAAVADRVSAELDDHKSPGLDKPGSVTPESIRDRMSAQNQRYPPFTMALRRLQKPTIAAVNGVAAGAGLDLALGCDIRIASDNASLNTMYYNRGIFALSGNVYFLLHLIGPARTHELLYTGQPISARYANEIGLVNRVVPFDKLREEVGALARRIADGPSVMLSLTKYVVSRTMDLTLESAMELASTAYYITRQTEDHKEGVTAFLEKRQPSFKGR